jgi:hypothetical protein
MSQRKAVTKMKALGCQAYARIEGRQGLTWAIRPSWSVVWDRAHP